MRRRLGWMMKVLLHIDYEAKKDFALSVADAVCCSKITDIVHQEFT